VIELRDIGVTFPGATRPSLDGVNLSIASGETVALAGPSGSGKTSLLRLLNALLLPTTGSVTVDGMDTRDDESLWEIRRRVGLVFQNPDDQIVSTTVERELAFGMENLGLDRDEMRSRVETLLPMLGLEPLRDRPPHRLSGGEKQRVAVAAVLAMRPRHLLLDEPTSLLDARGRADLWTLLAELRSREERTVIHVTQFPEEIAYADRAIVLVEGRVVFDAPPRDLFAPGSGAEDWGLRPPPAMGLARTLRAAGRSLPEDILTMDELIEALTGVRQ
jgi:energy-coupling factor transport system ATP-binding protein